MAMIIPEVVLLDIMEGLLTEVKLDYNRHGNKNDTLLYHFFGGMVNHKMDYFEQAVDLFVGRGEGNPRRIRTRMFFDAEKANIPTVHITNPSDGDGSNSIGVGEGSCDPTVDEVNGIITPIYSRRFSASYNIVCTSDNASECLLMYNFIRAMLISVFDTLSIAGLENVRITGNELSINPALVPNHLFMKSINLGCEYQIDVPRMFDQRIINKLVFDGLPVSDEE